ncbi:flagellar basal body protein [Leifsonia sp. L25]|uniref:flagellar basal body protein n=1 Tax=Leifsonia sp. L25 TaxID=3423957 RepID=UPI003D69B039
MLRSLYSGISGLRSHQAMLDVTGNNIANVNTTAFKASAVQFQDTSLSWSRAPAARRPRPAAPTPPRSASACWWRVSPPTSPRAPRRRPAAPPT